MSQRPTVDDFLAYMGLTLTADDPQRVPIARAFAAAQEYVEGLVRDGVLPDDPLSDAYPDSVIEATLLKANRYHKRKVSPEGVAGWGGIGQISILGSDPDIEELLGKLLKLDGFA